MSKKSKKKAASQADLRLMMKEMKKKRGNEIDKPVEHGAVTTKDIKAIQEMKFKLLKEPKKKSVSFSAKTKVTKTDKINNNNKTHKNGAFKKDSTKVPKKSSLKHKTDDYSKPSKRTKLDETEQQQPVAVSGLPADFFDSDFKPEGMINIQTTEASNETEKMEEEPAEKEDKSAIPEGFFDDPNKDAKVFFCLW